MSGAADAGTAGTVPAAGTTIPGETFGATDAGPESGSNEGIAREKGWRPKEEFDGDPETWVSADEFVKRQPLFDKLKLQSKKVKELEKTVEALSKHYSISVQQAKDRAIAELKLERKEAIELGEASRVEELDNQIDEYKKLPDPTPVKPTMATEIETFIDDHKDWFNKDEEMTQFAVAYNESYLARNPGDLQKSLDETLKKVKLAFPEHFNNSKRDNPPPVDGGGTPPGGGGGKYSMNRLTPEQKLVYAQIVTRHKQLSHDQYFKDLDEAGYLEK